MDRKYVKTLLNSSASRWPKSWITKTLLVGNSSPTATRKVSNRMGVDVHPSVHKDDSMGPFCHFKSSVPPPGQLQKPPALSEPLWAWLFQQLDNFSKMLSVGEMVPSDK